MTRRHPTPEERDERVSIPLDFEDALKGLLQVDPDELDEGEGERPESNPVEP